MERKPAEKAVSRGEQESEQTGSECQPFLARVGLASWREPMGTHRSTGRSESQIEVGWKQMGSSGAPGQTGR